MSQGGVFISCLLKKKKYSVKFYVYDSVLNIHLHQIHPSRHTNNISVDSQDIYKPLRHNLCSTSSNIVKTFP
jgi:hypothetical protein